jgi:hypothetical protein
VGAENPEVRPMTIESLLAYHERELAGVEKSLRSLQGNAAPSLVGPLIHKRTQIQAVVTGLRAGLRRRDAVASGP